MRLSLSGTKVRVSVGCEAVWINKPPSPFPGRIRANRYSFPK